MFTQKLSMDCTREQYEKYLKNDLLKMGYSEVYWQNSLSGAIVNNLADDLGDISNVHESDTLAHNRTYLGSFNAPLFLALAAMTDEKYGRYGEYWVFKGKNCAPEFISGNIYKAITPINRVWCFIDEMGDENGFSENEKYFRKATVSEIMQKFGKPKKEGKTINISIDATKLKSEIELAFESIIESIEKYHIDALKSKGYKILKPKTWEEV